MHFATPIIQLKIEQTMFMMVLDDIFASKPAVFVVRNQLETDLRTDGRTYGLTNQRTTTTSYGQAQSHLKILNSLGVGLLEERCPEFIVVRRMEKHELISISRQAIINADLSVQSIERDVIVVVYLMDARSCHQVKHST